MGILQTLKKSKKASPEAEKGSEKQTSANVGFAGGVVIRPLVTEKSAILASQNTYSFVVEKNANSIQVASAIEKMYGIKPVRVSTQNLRGKRVARGKIAGCRSAWKKAFVTLPKGKSINIYEGV